MKAAVTLLFVLMLVLAQAETTGAGKFAAHYGTLPDTGAKQYNKKLTFEIRVEPVTFFTVRYLLNYHGINPDGTTYSNSSVQSNMIYPGLAMAFGAALKSNIIFIVRWGMTETATNRCLPLGPVLAPTCCPAKLPRLCMLMQAM